MSRKTRTRNSSVFGHFSGSAASCVPVMLRYQDHHDLFHCSWSNGLVVWALDSFMRGFRFKITGWLQVWASLLSFWRRSNDYQKLFRSNQLSNRIDSIASRQFKNSHEKGQWRFPKFFFYCKFRMKKIWSSVDVFDPMTFTDQQWDKMLTVSLLRFFSILLIQNK